MTYDLPMGAPMGAWRAQAACKGMDTSLFFPKRGDSTRTINAAKKVCDNCPVRRECGEEARENPWTEGIWAGENRKSRRRAMGSPTLCEDCGADITVPKKVCGACRQERHNAAKRRYYREDPEKHKARVYARRGAA